MVMPLDDILKAISRGGGAGAQIAQGALKPRSYGVAAPTVRGIENLAASFGGPKASEPSKGPGGAFGLALKGLDLGRGLLVSSIKEGIDFSQDVLAGRVGDGEWSPTEWWSQATNHYGFGDLIEDERDWVGAGLMVTSPFTGGVGLMLGAAVMADNIWADRVVGFIGDVALDPLMYLGGFGAIARGMSATKVTQTLGRFAKMSADDMFKAALIKAPTAAAAKPLQEAALTAVTAASKGRSLSAASRSLLKTDAGKKVAKHLGLDPGFRMRMPGTGPAGRLLRQDRWLDAAGKVVGRPDWIAKSQYKNLAPMFKNMFDKDEMIGAIAKFRSTPLRGGRKQKMALMEEMTTQHGASFAEAVGMASRSAVEIAIPGMVGKGARAGLAANLISKVADFPIRGAHRLPERLQQKVSANFNPNNSLRAMEQSDDPISNLIAAHARDRQRYARGMERAAMNNVGGAQDAAIMRSAGAKVSDKDFLDFAEAHTALVKDADFDVVEAALDNTFTGAAQINRQGLWYERLPDSVKALSDEEFYFLALKAEEYAAVTSAVLRDTFGEVPLAGGASVWPAEHAVALLEGMPWRSARRLTEKSRSRFMQPRHFEEDGVTPKYDFDAYKPGEGKVGGSQTNTMSWDATGRVTPASLKNRAIGQVNEPVLVYNEAGATPGSIIDWVKDGEVQRFTGTDGSGLGGQVKRILADPANPEAPFLVQHPDSVGLSARRQIDEVSMVAFGDEAFEGEFSVVADAWRKGMGRDIRMHEFLKRMKEEFPLEQLDEYLDEIERAFVQWEGEAAFQAKKTTQAVRQERIVQGKHEVANRQQQRAAAQTEDLRTVRTPEVERAQAELDKIDAQQAAYVEEIADLEAAVRANGLEFDELQRVSRKMGTKAYKEILERSNQLVLRNSDAAARLEFIKDAAAKNKAVRDAAEKIIRTDADLFAAEVSDTLEAVTLSATRSTKLKKQYDIDVAAYEKAKETYDIAVKSLNKLSGGRGVAGLERTLAVATREAEEALGEVARKAWVSQDGTAEEAASKLAQLTRADAENRAALERLIGPEGRVRFDETDDIWRVEGNVGGELGAARAAVEEAIVAGGSSETRRKGTASARAVLEAHEKSVVQAAKELSAARKKLSDFDDALRAQPVKMDKARLEKYQTAEAKAEIRYEQEGGARTVYEGLSEGARLDQPPEGVFRGVEVSADFTQTGTSRAPTGPKGPPKRLTVGETADWARADREAFLKGDVKKKIPPGVIGGDARRGELIPAPTVSHVNPRFQTRGQLGSWDEAHRTVERLTVEVQEATAARKSLGGESVPKKGERVEGVWVKGEGVKVRLTKEGKRRAEIPAERAALEQRIAAGKEEIASTTRPSTEWRARAEERIATGKARIAEWDAVDPSTVDVPHWLPAARRRVAELEQQIEMAAKTEAAGIPVRRLGVERAAVQRRVAELEQELLSPAMELKPTYEQLKATETTLRRELRAAKAVTEAQEGLAARAHRGTLDVPGFERGYRTREPARGAKGRAVFTPEPGVRIKLTGAQWRTLRRLHEAFADAKAGVEALQNPGYVEGLETARAVLAADKVADAALQRSKGTAAMVKQTDASLKGAVTNADEAWRKAEKAGPLVRLGGVTYAGGGPPVPGQRWPEPFKAVSGGQSTGRLMATNPNDPDVGIVVLEKFRGTARDELGALAPREGTVHLAKREGGEWVLQPWEVPSRAKLKERGWQFADDAPPKGTLGKDDPLTVRLEQAYSDSQVARVAADKAVEDLDAALETLGIPYRSGAEGLRTHPVVPPQTVRKIRGAVDRIPRKEGGRNYNTDPATQQAIGEGRRYTYAEAQQLTDLQKVVDDTATELWKADTAFGEVNVRVQQAGGLRPEARAAWAAREARDAGVDAALGRQMAGVAEPRRPAPVEGWYSSRKEIDAVYGLDVRRLNDAVANLERMLTDASLKAAGIAKSSPEVKAMRALIRLLGGGRRRGGAGEVAGTQIMRKAGKHPEDIEQVNKLRVLAQKQRVAASEAAPENQAKLFEKAANTEKRADKLFEQSRRVRVADPLERAEGWVNIYNTLVDAERVVGHDRFVAATKGVAAAMEGRSGVEAFNKAYAKVMRQLGLEDWAVSGTLRDPRQGETALSRQAVREVPVGGQGERTLTIGGKQQTVDEVVARLEFGKELEAAHTKATTNLDTAKAEVVRVTKYGNDEAQKAKNNLEDIAWLEKEASDRELREWASFLETGDEVQVAEFQRLLGEGRLFSVEPATDVVTREARAGAARPNRIEQAFKDVMNEVQDRAVGLDRPGIIPDKSVREGIFALNAGERKTAQIALKDAVSKSKWGPWTLMSGDAALDRDMLNIIDAFAKINDHEEWGLLWQGWNKVQTYLKSAMIATPGFVQRNIFGAFFNAWLDGVNLNEIVSSTRMTMSIAREASDKNISFLQAARGLAKSTDDASLRSYVSLLEVGVRGGGQAVSAVDLGIGLRNARSMELLVGRRSGGGKQYSVSVKPWSPRFAPYQAVRTVNSWVEDVVRLGVGMDTLRYGGSVDDALARIAKSQFDYDELTQFERKWMKSIFPFYTWTRKNVPYQLQQIMKHPDKYNKLLSAKRNLELGSESEDVVPDYFLEPFGIRLPFAAKGGTVYTAPDIPFQDLGRYDPFQRGGWKKAATNLVSSASPLLKAPLEVAFGKQVFNGIPFRGRYQKAPAAISGVPFLMDALSLSGVAVRSPHGEWKMRDHHIYLITNVLPTLGVVRRLFPNEPKYQRNFTRSLMSTMFGMSANFNTAEVQSNWLTSQRYDRLIERNDRMDIISRTR